MATVPSAQSQVQDFSVNGGSFRGTQNEYNSYLTTHPQIQSEPQGKTSVPNTMDASNLGSTKMDTPDLPNVSSTDSFVTNLFSQYNAPVEAVQQERTDLTNKLTTASTALEGKGNAQLAKENELGVTADTTKLKDLNTLIATKTAEYQNRIASFEGAGRGATTGFVAAQTDREKRLQAVELGGLASVAQALQGNIALSQATAKSAVDMQFAPYEQEIKNTLQLLELNSDNLTRAESKRAAEISIALSERQRLLEEAKADKMKTLDFAQQAALAGADNTTVTNILNAPNAEAAFKIGGAILSQKAREAETRALQDRALDNQLKQAQIKNVMSEIANRNNGTQKGVTIQKINGVDYVVNADGSFSLPILPEAANDLQKNKINEIVSSLDALSADSNLSKAVGPISSKLPTLRGGTADFESKFKSTVAQLAIDNLSLLKGPMSDKDIEFIKQAGSSLSLGMSEQGFKDEISRIKNKLLLSQSNIKPTPGQLGVVGDSILVAKNQGYSNTDIISALSKDAALASQIKTAKALGWDEPAILLFLQNQKVK